MIKTMMGGDTHCLNSTVNEINKQDKHREYFFKDYNDAYNIETGNASRSILPFNKPSYFKENKNKQNKKLNDNNKIKLTKNISTWTLDSGTTYHMICDPNLLSNYKKHNRRIYFANGEYVKCRGIGTYIGYINDNKITLKNVLYVPSFKKNLLSVDCLSEQGYKTVFCKRDNKNCVILFNSKNNRICTTYSNYSRTYIIWTSKNKINFYNNDINCNNANSEEEESLYVWHRRLGHYNLGTLRKTLKRIYIKCKCKTCAKTKLKSFPHYPSDSRATEPFELIHMDTVTINSRSMYGNKYFVSILDDYTRFGWVLFIKSKRDVFNAFLNWYNNIKNIFNKNIKRLRTDNGTEFTNNKIIEFCNINGITHEFSVPYEPQQNGRIERLHGSLLPNARAMLEDAHLNHVFWEDAIRTANYIHNRMPHRGIDNNVPYELLYNEKVDYSRFRVFGCQVFFLVPKQFRNKLTNTSLPGIFLGYDTNPTAYRIFDITNNKVVISRSVVFFEDIPGNGSAPSSPPDLINFTPYYEIGGSNDDEDVVDFEDNNVNDKSINENNNNMENSTNNNVDNNNNMNNNINDNINGYTNYYYNNLDYSPPNNLYYYNPYAFVNYPNNFQNHYAPNQYNLNPYNNLNYCIPPNYYNYTAQNFPSPVLNSQNGHSINYQNLNVSNNSNINQNNSNQLNSNDVDHLNQNNLNNNSNQNNSDNNDQFNSNNLNQGNLNNLNQVISNNNLKQGSPNDNLNQAIQNDNVNKNNRNNLNDQTNSINNASNINNVSQLTQNNSKYNNTRVEEIISKIPRITDNGDYNKRDGKSIDLNNLTNRNNNSSSTSGNSNAEINQNINKQNVNKPYASKSNVSTSDNMNKDKESILSKRKHVEEMNEEELNDRNESNNYKKRRASNYYNLVALNCSEMELPLPNSYKDIFDRPDKEEWLKAIETELNNMKDMEVYTLVKEIPKGKNIISAKWVFSYKRNDVGIIIRFKARLVARGFTQIYGIDYIETFSPTLKQDSLRVIIAISIYYGFEIYQIDIKAAYLNADLEEELYMEIPEGSEDYGKGYWKLNKAIYGLKQAGRMWNNKLDSVLTEIGFERLKSEPCVYILKDKNKNIICIIAIYVDDILISGKKSVIDRIKLEIKDKFNLSDLGMVDFIIGIKFIKCKDGYIMHQIQYLNDILDRFDIDKYNAISNMMYTENEKLRETKFDKTTYMQAVGCLLYLAMGTRPDIMYATSKATRKNQDPTLEDWMNVIKIFRYLKGTKHYGLKITKDINIRVYVDADLGGDRETKRSTTGFVIFMGSAPMTWYSKLQHCVAISTAESEYYSLNECALKCMWLRNLLNELGIKIDCITINIDNRAAIYNSKNETINPKSRHIDLRYHKIRELIKEDKIDLKYIKSQYNIADGFTKYLNGTLTKKFKNSLLYKIYEY